MIMDKSKSASTYIAVIVSVILITLFSIFLIKNNLSELSYVSLVTISLLSGFIIYFQDRIEAIDLKKMKIILNETKAFYQSTKNIAEHIVEIIGFLSAYGSGTGEQRKKLNNKIRNFLKTIGTNKQKINKIMENPKLMEKAMSDQNILKSDEEKLRKKGLL